MNKVVSIAILIVGVLLIVFGIQAAQPFASDVSRLFAGSPTNQAIWMLISGILLSVIGRVGSLRPAK